MRKTILLVEDNKTLGLIIEHVAKDIEPQPSLIIARDGAHAVAYLNGDQSFQDRARFPLPRIVILDIDLPRLNGFQVLRWIRQQPAYSLLPVIMFTSSQKSADVELAYRLGASGYMVKPFGLQALHTMLRVVNRFWLQADGSPNACSEWLGLNVPRPPVSLHSQTIEAQAIRSR